MARALRRFDRDQEQQEDAVRIARILEESPEVKPPTGATAGGDERKLRGIPVLSRGVSGAIPGSSPHRALL